MALGNKDNKVEDPTDDDAKEAVAQAEVQGSESQDQDAEQSTAQSADAQESVEDADAGQESEAGDDDAPAGAEGNVSAADASPDADGGSGNGTEVAGVQNTQVARHADGGMQQNLEHLAEQGYDGLEINWTSFDIIRLEEGSFVDQDDYEMGDEFKVVIQGTRPKFAIASKHEEDDDREVVYSYVKNPDKTDPEVIDTIQKWKEEDEVGYEIKQYVEAVAEVLDDGTEEGEKNDEMVTLQIPPASIGKLTGHIAKCQLKGHGNNPSQYVTTISKGKKVGTGQKAFTPWKFTYGGALPE